MKSSYTKVVMIVSALIFAAAGLILLFLPVKIINYFSLEFTKTAELLIQLSGALYFSIAMLNWMSRSNIIGGIYNKPIAISNFTHCFIAGLSLISAQLTNSDLPPLLWMVSLLYVIFALLFGLIAFRQPNDTKNYK